MTDLQLLIIVSTLICGIALASILVIWNFQTLADEIL